MLKALFTLYICVSVQFGADMITPQSYLELHFLSTKTLDSTMDELNEVCEMGWSAKLCTMEALQESCHSGWSL